LAVAGISLFTSFSAAARDGQTVSVMELRSQIRGNVDVAALTDQVRDAARRAMPNARVLPHQDMLVVPAEACTYDCDVISAREQGADLVATGDITASNPGFRVSLTLRGVRSGQVIARSAAESVSLSQIAEAVLAAAIDLFRGASVPAPSSAVVSVDSPSLPDLPALPAANVPEGGAVNLSVDANVLVAYDHARNVEARGKDHPDDAAYAWEAVANADGENPYRAMAAARAQQWHAYADSKHSYESQLARDTSRLRKVLPLASVTDTVKLELLSRYAHAYGSARAQTLLPYVPAGPLRDRAVLAMGCEGNDPGRCIALAKFAEESSDSKAAAEAWDHACQAGAFAACADSAARFIGTDVQRAVAALTRGCGGGDARSCTQAAKLYEQGTSVKADAAVAAEFRDKACAAGDGKSCRKMACAVDASDSAADQKRAAELFKKGCAGGDSTSCVLARVANSSSSSSSTGVQHAMLVDPSTGVQHVVSTSSTSSTSSSGKSSSQQAPVQATASDDKDAHPALGAALVGVGLLAAGGAFILATEGPDTSALRTGRTALNSGAASSGGSHIPLVPVLGAAAVLTTATGLGVLWFSRHDEKKEKPGDVNVGISPAGVMLQGKLP
jgi:TPR repeat protein